MNHAYTNRAKLIDKYVESIEFGEFDMLKEMNDFKNFSAVLFAKRRSGKSVLVRDMMSKIKDWYETAYIFCETIHAQGELYNFIPKQNQFSTFDERMLKTIYATQEEKIQKLTSIYGESKKPTFPHIIVIFDDFINDPRVREAPIFKKYAVMGRHQNIAFVCLSQCVGGRDGIPKGVRGNLDLIVTFMIESYDDRESIIKQFLSLNNKMEGDCIMRKITYCPDKPYQAMVICNFKKSSNYQEIVKTYNAELDIKDFYIGKKMVDGANLIRYENKFRRCFEV